MVMSFTGISVFLSVIILNLYEKSKNTKSKYRLPYFVRLIFLDFLAKKFGIKKDEKTFFQMMANDLKNIHTTSTKARRETQDQLFINITNDLKKNKLHTMMTTNYVNSPPNLRKKNFLNDKQRLKRIEKYESQIKRQLDDEKLKLYYSYEWLYLSLVIDRVLFWIFTFTTCVAYLLTLFVYPFLIQPNKNESFEI